MQTMTAAEAIVSRFEAAGLRVIPRGGHDATVRGRFGMDEDELVRDLLPARDAHWHEVVALLADRESATAKASLAVLTVEAARRTARTVP